MPIEFYYSPYCTACASPRVRASAKDIGVVAREITEHLAEAVSLGIVQPPALVVDGRVVAQGAAAIRELEKLTNRG